MPRSGAEERALWPGARSAEYRLTAKWGRDESAPVGEPEWLGGAQAGQPWSGQDSAGDVVRLDPSASDGVQSPDQAGAGEDELRLQRLQTAALLLQQRRGATARDEQHQQKSPDTARLQQLQGAAMRLRATRSTGSQAAESDAVPETQGQGQQAVSAVDNARPSRQALISAPGPAADAGSASQNLIQDHLDRHGRSAWPAEAAAPASREGPSNFAEASAVLTPSASALTVLQPPPPPPPPPPKSPAELKSICHKMRRDGLVNSMMPDSEIIRTMKLLTVAAALAVLGPESHAVMS